MKSLYKSVLWVSLFLISTLSWARENCDLAIDMIGVRRQSESYVQDLFDVLKEKGYTNLRFFQYPRDSKSLYLSFDHYGVFNIDYKARITLVDDSKITYDERILFNKEVRTFGGDEFKFYKRLSNRLPDCRDI